MKLFPVHISNFKIDGGAMFGVVPKAIWVKKYPSDENNLCTWSLRSLLVDAGDQKILVDNGYGDKQSEKFFRHVHLHGGDGLEGGLARYGYTPDDITDMVLTHLHADHCGGGICYNEDKTGFEPVFKNATYWVSKTQWDWAMNPNQREKDSFLKENLLPMQESGLLKFVYENMELFPGFRLRMFNGHTKGQMIPFIDYKGRTIVFTADLIPSVTHIPIVYNMSYDVFPLETLKEKDHFLHEALDNNYILFFQHDAYTECCNLRMTEKGIREKDTFALKEFIQI